jgi:CRP-like cAMP-binding protein
MESTARATITNGILAALPPEEYQRILPHLEPFDFEVGRVLYELEGPIDYMYFPYGALVSLVREMADGKVIEVGMVGKDGMTGLAFLMAEERSAERALVQIPNGGVRAKATVVKEEFDRGGALQKVLLVYANALMRQMAQTAACNTSHTVEERLARWLLMCQDLVESNRLDLTQEFIAEMLGTRRATVNVAAINLQSAELIRYNRGHIVIKDRSGLEGYSCECYATLKKLSGGNECQR